MTDMYVCQHCFTGMVETECVYTVGRQALKGIHMHQKLGVGIFFLQNQRG